MRNIVMSVLLVLVGLTSCAPVVPEQPIITYTPSNTTLSLPIITPADTPITLTPSNAPTSPPAIIPSANPYLTTSNMTSTLTSNTTAVVDAGNEILQVCFNGSFQSFGVAVEDGSYVFTILEYIDFNLSEGTLSVVSTEGSFAASVFSFDPRNGATLLKLKDHQLKPVKLIASANISKNKPAVVWHSRPGVGLVGVISNVTSAPGTSDPIKFGIALPPNTWNFDREERMIVTDAAGGVLGIIPNESFSSYILGDGTTIPTAMPQLPDTWLSRAVISSDIVETLLSEDVSKQPWANGPVAINILDKQPGITRGTGFAEAPGNYNHISAELQSLFKQVGPALTDNESNILLTRSGKSVSVYYAFPVTLYSGNQAVAMARWFNIEWDRLDGLPNNIIYGNSPQSRAVGGFTITSNISTLKYYIDNPYF